MAAEFATDAHWGRYVLIGTIALLVLFIVLHLIGGGMHGH